MSLTVVLGSVAVDWTVADGDKGGTPGDDKYGIPAGTDVELDAGTVNDEEGTPV